MFSSVFVCLSVYLSVARKSPEVLDRFSCKVVELLANNLVENWIKNYKKLVYC